MRHFDHIDLRVADIAAARSFYQEICGPLGFPHVDAGREWICFGTSEYPNVGEYIAITEDRTYRAGANSACHALWTASKVEVDEIAVTLRDAGCPNLEGPAMFYRGHYAVYFTDPWGNRFEVCYREYTHGFDDRIPEEKMA